LATFFLAVFFAAFFTAFFAAFFAILLSPPFKFILNSAFLCFAKELFIYSAIIQNYRQKVQSSFIFFVPAWVGMFEKRFLNPPLHSPLVRKSVSFGRFSDSFAFLKMD